MDVVVDEAVVVVVAEGAVGDEALHAANCKQEKGRTGTRAYMHACMGSVRGCALLLLPTCTQACHLLVGWSVGYHECSET